MKKLILLFTALICISLTSCTVTDRHRNAEPNPQPTQKEYYLPAGYELIGVSMAGGLSSTPVFITRPMAEDYIPETKVIFTPEFHDAVVTSVFRVIETK
jgi:hypothetical protein